MANDEHVSVLGRGAAAWNEWRADRDETPALSRAGLRGLDLSGFDLPRADLRGADLRGTKLSGANLSGAHLDVWTAPTSSGQCSMALILPGLF
jgi:uncharacterized protein YjbI with pentapeptide repeats